MNLIDEIYELKNRGITPLFLIILEIYYS